MRTPSTSATAVDPSVTPDAAGHPYVDTGIPPFGALLKSWRNTRRYSQLDLALEAGISQRHLSFLESGRSQPSRDMIQCLAIALQIPLRERNGLLLAAGYAPGYLERPLESPEMRMVKQAMEATLQHHLPYPALAVDRHWDLVSHNSAVDRLLGILGAPADIWRRVDPSGGQNLLRLTLHPQGLQPLIRNWQRVAPLVLRRLQQEAAANPTNLRLRALFSELCGLPGIPLRWPEAPGGQAPPPAITLELGTEMGTPLRLFSMVCTFGTAQDVTAAELRLELFFPGDETTAAFFRGKQPLGSPNPDERT